VFWGILSSAIVKQDGTITITVDEGEGQAKCTIDRLDSGKHTGMLP
jgi:hypothetical protein